MNNRRAMLDRGAEWARELVDTWRAYAVGRRLAGAPMCPHPSGSHDLLDIDPRMRFQHHPYFEGDGEGEKLVYRFGPYVTVELSKFRPVSGTKPTITFGTGVLLDERIVGLGTAEIMNDGPEPITTTEGVTRGRSSQSREQDSASITALVSLRQQISYGGELYGFGGETEISASLEAAVARENERILAESTSRTREMNYVIRPHHVALETRTRKIGHWRQDVTITGQLDWTSKLTSDGEYEAVWADRRELRDVLQGVGTVRVGRENFAKLVAERPWEPYAQDLDPRYSLVDKLAKLCGGVERTLKTTREFEKAEHVERSYSQKPIG